MLSIIIPALNEARTIGTTLSQLQRMSGDFEVLVVDGESGDGTRKIAEQMGVRVIKSERSLPRQLMHGAMEANGDMFLFLHADCKLPQEAILTLNDLEEKEVHAGAFTHQYDRFNPLLTLQASLNNLNAKLFKIYGGEQAIFVKKSVFEKIGGIPECLVLEDKKLSRALKDANATTVFLDGPVVSSARRYRKAGIVPFLSINWAHVLHDLGASDYRLKKFFPAIR